MTLTPRLTILSLLLAQTFPEPCPSNTTLKLLGLRLEIASEAPKFHRDGTPILEANHDHELRLFGTNFADSMLVTFTAENLSRGEKCERRVEREFPIIADSHSSSVTVRIKANLPVLKQGQEDFFYICIMDGRNNKSGYFQHQGSDYWLIVCTGKNPVPLWAAILIAILCMTLSSCMSGLNLGLMALTPTELKIVTKSGNVKERKYATTILPVRQQGNYLLCSIVLGNVLFNALFTVFMDELTTGIVAVLISTIIIVIVCEITPQAVFSRYGLLIGAKTIYLTKVVMVATFPASYPISKALDYFLGGDIINVYSRQHLREMISLIQGNKALGNDEVNIISGALEIHNKTVAEVMTKIEDVFMLEYDTLLDFEIVEQIITSGYTRIPVYMNDRRNIINVLHIKNLAFIDTEDSTPLKTLCEFYQNPFFSVFENMSLSAIFQIFKEGNKGHMAFVERISSDGTEEIVGLITLEDVIEEIIQAEIMDETDVFTDNRQRHRRQSEWNKSLKIVADKRDFGKAHVNPQLYLATYQFLKTSVEKFQPPLIPDGILKRLLKQNIFYQIKKNKNYKFDDSCAIYKRGVIADYFVLILEGKVEVVVGREDLILEGGPFMYFGAQVLDACADDSNAAQTVKYSPSVYNRVNSFEVDSTVRSSFVPDYSVRARGNVVYLKVSAGLYCAARKAGLMEKSLENIKS